MDSKFEIDLKYRDYNELIPPAEFNETTAYSRQVYIFVFW